jgi:NAD(P)-dependent dehydrogenase (short-subunit alcohol dehydrogenase family)
MNGTISTPQTGATSFLFHDLRKKTVVVTGAANGIGRVLATGLAQQGCRLILLDRDAARLEELAAQLADTSTLTCDLSDPPQRREAVEKIGKIAPVVDGIIHNAAIDPRKSLEETDLNFFQHVMATNVEPAIEITRGLLPQLRRSTAGRILFIGSLTFEIGTALLSSYVASKGAIVGLTRSLAHELGREGITVNCISPGAIDVEKVYEYRRQQGKPEHESEVVKWQSVKRPLVPADLLGITCLLLSEAGGAITGQVISVDGGLTHPIADTGLQATHIAQSKAE